MSHVEELLRQAGAFDRQQPEAWRKLAWQAVEQGKTEEAIACFQELVRLNPGMVEGWANLGALHLRSGRPHEAAHSFGEATAREPDNLPLVKAWIRALRAAGQRPVAVEQCERLIAVTPSDAEIIQLLGNLFQELDQYDEAISQLNRAMRLVGRTPSLLSNLGIALFRRGDLEEATSLFRQAVQLEPRNPDPHFHLGMALLSAGDYEFGWQEYEWRPGGRFHPAPRPLPIWNGEPLAGKALLLAAEQGFGDTIQFVRFAARVKQQYGCRTLLYCQEALLPLLKTCAGIDEFLPRDQPLPPVDCYVPLVSIPSILRFHPEQEAKPSPYLFANEARVAQWSAKLEQRISQQGTAGMKVGLSWQGDPKFPADRCRSIPLSFFEPLIRCEAATFVSLQKGFGVDQISQMSPRSLIDFGNQLDASGGAFLDTAALMQSLDLVITSDTAIAHLAGALGVPVWLALAKVPDWRWQLERNHSPWYPSTTLFRQERHGDWSTIVGKMEKLLSERKQDCV